MLTFPTFTNNQKAVVFFATAQIAFGIVTLFCNQDIFQYFLNSEGTKTFQAWKDSPIPAYSKFYFFSMLNAEDFQKHNVKPILEERGPYTFREHQQKAGLIWHDDGTISYYRRKFWYFEPEMSVGPLTDRIVTLNLPMVTAVNYARGKFYMEYGLSDMLQTVEASLFINRTVGELLFDGYEDPILKIGASFNKEKRTVPIDRFGWFYKRNGTSWADGQLRMFTGEKDINTLGDIKSWNGQTKTTAYPGKCGEIRGSADGLLAPGKLKHLDSFDIWSTDTCRTFTFKREAPTSVHGIPADKFKLADDIFANGTLCKDNECYGNNLPTGVQNVSQCKMKAPAYLSRPHFSGADGFYVNQFQYGIKPNITKYESYFLVEPQTSIPLGVKMALQLNIKIEKSEGMEYIFKNLSTVYFPIVWFESSFDIPGTIAGALRFLVNIPTIMVIASVFGILAGMVGIYIVYRQVSPKISSDQKLKKNYLTNAEKFTFFKGITAWKHDMEF